MSTNELFLGLDIGGTKCAAVLGTADGRIVDRVEWPSHAERGAMPMIDDLCRHARALLEKHGPDGKVRAAGASIGGPLDAEQGIILSPPNLPGWDKIPLKRLIEDRLGLPTRVEHDAAACCLAEYFWGAGRGASRLIYLTCGTGFGAGLVFDGNIYRGAGGRNVEVGHARFRDEGPVAFGKKGSMESFCAAGALGRIAAWKFPVRWATAPSSKQIADAAASGDADAKEVLAINARAVGEVSATLADLLRPDLILLGSLAQYLGASWVEMVRSQFRLEALPATYESCRIEAAGLGARLQDCSALVVAVAAAIVQLHSVDARVEEEALEHPSKTSEGSSASEDHFRGA